jgi:hypothetical protein
VAAARDPERAADAARDVQDVGSPLVDPGRGHRSDELLEHVRRRSA